MWEFCCFKKHLSHQTDSRSRSPPVLAYIPAAKSAIKTWLPNTELDIHLQSAITWFAASKMLKTDFESTYWWWWLCFGWLSTTLSKLSLCTCNNRKIEGSMHDERRRGRTWFRKICFKLILAKTHNIYKVLVFFKTISIWRPESIIKISWLNVDCIPHVWTTKKIFSKIRVVEKSVLYVCFLKDNFFAKSHGWPLHPRSDNLIGYENY